MKVMITAGCTVEKIDSVRSISNFSTGTLGSLIAESFSALPEIEKIYYLCNKTALLPQCIKTEIEYVDSVESLENAVIKILKQCDIDIIIHSMAVSDYRVISVDSVANVASLIAANFDTLKHMNETDVESFVLSLLTASPSIMDRSGKIGSEFENLLLMMEKTKKVISIFQNISPQSLLVGFKLLDDVSYETLIETGYRILLENKCGFVLANDMREIGEHTHIGYLIDTHKNCQRFTTKKEIANAIVSATIEKREV